MVQNLTKDNFQEALDADLSLVTFSASWCGPCRMQAPVLEELSREKGDVQFFRVDVDEERELATHFKVMSIPALFIIKDGKIVQNLMGYNDKNALENALAQYE